MEGLEKYLQKIRNLLSSEEDQRKVIKQSIQDVLKKDIKDNEIKKKNGIFILLVSPVFKTEISLKKELIKEKIRDVYGKDIPFT